MNTDHTYYSVGEYRGVRRIWLEGGPLEKRGFTKGVTYRREIDEASKVVRLIRDPNGKLVVSGKEKLKDSGDYLPIIDLKNQTITQLTENADEVRVDFADGEIVISVSHMVRQQREREAALLAHARKGYITEGTLCAGVGMATLALHEGLAQHGIEMKTRWVMDREAKYLQLAVENNPAVTAETRLFTGPLERVEPSLVDSVDICQLSLPCTSHSSAGKAKNKNVVAEAHRTDATAVYGLMKLFDSINAAIYCSENVVEARNSASFILIKQTLEILGYRVAEGVLDSEQSGSLEHRRRYWFVAVSSGLPAADFEQIPVYPKAHRTVKDIMDDIPDDSPMWSDNDYLKIKAVKDEAAGKGFRRQLLNTSSERVPTLNRTYHKRQSTGAFLVREIDQKERLLTLAEQARAKQCDPSLVAGATFTTGTEVLGQGIDMGQGRGIAEMIARCVINPLLGVQQAVGDSVKAQVASITHNNAVCHAGEHQMALFG